MLRIVFAVMLALAPAGAGAGPWPREKGERFLSLGATFSDRRQELAGHGELGLGRGWTLGFNAAADRRGDGRALVLLSRALGRGEGRLRFALEAGAGQYSPRGAAAQFVLRGGVSVGTGWGGARAGWARLDILAESRAGTLAVKTDATVGMRLSGRLTAILQAEGDWGAASTLVVAPGVVWRLRERIDLHLAGQVAVVGPADTGVRLATWIRF
jgi:hypothetical protein